MLLLNTNYIKYYKGRLKYEKIQLNSEQSFLSKSINAVQLNIKVNEKKVYNDLILIKDHQNKVFNSERHYGYDIIF